MGTVKGRIGSQVFYVSHGEQNIIKHQPNVSNPKTNRQSYQRSRFSNTAKFYTQGNEAFYKFAFEYKKKGESDFNAFMRENITRSPLISRNAHALYGYPALGEWVMSHGSLRPIETMIVGDVCISDTLVQASDTTVPTTIGGLAEKLIAGGNYNLRDILTFVHIWVEYPNGVVIPSATPDTGINMQWDIVQIILDPADTTPLSDKGLYTVYNTISNKGWSISYPMQTTGNLNFFTCVHSRNTSSGLKTSTQVLSLDSEAEYALEKCNDDNYKAECIASWQETEAIDYPSEVILKGALASKAASSPTPPPTTGMVATITNGYYEDGQIKSVQSLLNQSVPQSNNVVAAVEFKLNGRTITPSSVRIYANSKGSATTITVNTSESQEYDSCQEGNKMIQSKILIMGQTLLSFGLSSLDGATKVTSLRGYKLASVSYEGTKYTDIMIEG